MQYLKLFSLLALIVLLSQCQSKNPDQNNTDPLRFEERSISRQSSTCGTDSTRCATLEVIYPEAVAGDPAAMQAMNDTISYYVKMTLALGEGIPETIAAGVDSFIQSYENYIKEDSVYITPWEVQTNAKVMYQSPEYISVEVANYSYTGGAHPNSYVNLLTFDANTGKKLQVTDIVSDTARLKTLAEAKFREVRELSPDADLNEEGYFWGEPFALPANIALTNEGLYFVYNPYEAAAYAAGPTDFTITNEELKGMLKER